MRNPDGLIIPLKGVSSDDVEINIQRTDSGTNVKLTVREEGHQPFERVLPLTGENLDVKAHFVNGQLRLRW
jgi:HSP20 family molecular chaperone IbpA